MIRFENKYGSIEAELCSDYVPISSIHSRNLQDEVFFDVGTAEKVALILESERTQISCAWPDLERFYVIHHDSASTGAVMRITAMEYAGGNARQIIKDQAPSVDAMACRMAGI